MQSKHFLFPSGIIQFLMILLLFSAAGVSAQSMFRKALDFDGDGRADYAITRNQNGSMIWYIWQSSAGLKVVHWGVQYDTPAAGDYDGDGKTDLAVYRETLGSNPAITYTFHILQSQTGSYVTTSFTDNLYNFNAPLHQDYDGDGKTDPSAYYGEFGFSLLPMRIRLSATNSTASLTVPHQYAAYRIGDIDGDHRAEVAFASSGTLQLSNYDSSNPRTVDISTLNGVLIPADFDGDGKGELAVWRDSDGTWLWIRSSDGVMQSVHWGLSGDSPVPADYDGDGKTDLAIWRPGAQSYYWIYGSQNGLSIIAWGVSGDRTVRY